MDTIYGTTVAYAAPIFLLAVAIEVLIGRLRGTRYYNLADAVTSVGCGTSYIGARVAFGFAGLAAYELVLRHAAPVHLPAAHWGTWIFAFVLYDLCYYWSPRLSHTVGFLWASHVVHHQSEEFNLTTALRQPASVPLTVYLAVGITQLLYQFWPHTPHIGRLTERNPVTKWSWRIRF
jgi:sterol desaturase/sphingolipid hydroxylase (fatty acid hydroxylase superfamily)